MSHVGRRVRFLKGTGVDGRLYGAGEETYLPLHEAQAVILGGRAVEVKGPVAVPVDPEPVRIAARDPVVRRRR